MQCAVQLIRGWNVRWGEYKFTVPDSTSRSFKWKVGQYHDGNYVILSYIAAEDGNMKQAKLIISLLFSILVIIHVNIYLYSSYSTGTDFERGPSLLNRSLCELGEFQVGDMARCEPLLTCLDIQSQHFQVGRWIGGGAVKNVTINY